MLSENLSSIGLEIFPSPGSTRRQVIHSLDLLVRFGSSQNEQKIQRTHKIFALHYFMYYIIKLCVMSAPAPPRMVGAGSS
jgi:hypothetical protein